MPPQFLVVGHVVQDLISPDSATAWRLGGTASYAALLARNLGLRAAVLTAAAPDLPLARLLPGIECHCLPSPHTTQISNVYDGGRRQRIPQRASSIGPEDLPRQWRSTPIVLLGPVVGEVDAALAAGFPRSLIGVGAQGWLREIAPDGGVRPVPPRNWQAAPILRASRALFVSDEDLPPDGAVAALKEWSALIEIVAFTHGDRGADVCLNGQWRRMEAFPALTVDPTGAGDVFAAAFLIRLHETEDVWESARFAACAASFVVEGEGTTAIPDRAHIEARLAAHPEVTPRPT